MTQSFHIFGTIPYHKGWVETLMWWVGGWENGKVGGWEGGREGRGREVRWEGGKGEAGRVGRWEDWKVGWR